MTWPPAGVNFSALPMKLEAPAKCASRARAPAEIAGEIEHERDIFSLRGRLVQRERGRGEQVRIGRGVQLAARAVPLLQVEDVSGYCAFAGRRH